MLALMFHPLIFDSLYNKYLIQYLISLDGGVVLANRGINRLESDFIYEDYFWVHLSEIGIDLSEQLSETKC